MLEIFDIELFSSTRLPLVISGSSSPAASDAGCPVVGPVGALWESPVGAPGVLVGRAVGASGGARRVGCPWGRCLGCPVGARGCSPGRCQLSPPWGRRWWEALATAGGASPGRRSGGASWVPVGFSAEVLLVGGLLPSNPEESLRRRGASGVRGLPGEGPALMGVLSFLLHHDWENGQ